MNLLKLSLSLLWLGGAHAVHIESDTRPVTTHTTAVQLMLKPSPQEHIYSDSILISSNNPDVQVSSYTANKQPETLYDQQYKKNMPVYTSDITLSLEATHANTSSLVQPNLHISLISNLSDQPIETVIPLHFTIADHPQPTSPEVNQTPAPILEEKTEKVSSSSSHFLKTWSKKIQSTLAQTESWGLRLLFAFLLGLLMSLTPCIYPMIPITVGILQSQGTPSLFRNFLLSLTYTLGLATTFAALGFVAATSGAAFGHLMGNPLFVLTLVVVLGYFAFSLFGFYPLYIPRFLQQKQSFSNKGSFLSIFLFGLASGSVASPCLSPGLALVLTMVAAIAHKTLGFLLLFVFGIGVSFPLLIIGTFSSSLSILPRAGMWMLEVQKIFGFMLLGMCIYYLSAILPTVLLHILLTLLMLIITVYYYYSISSLDSIIGRYLKTLLCIITGAITIFCGMQTLQEYYYKKSVAHATHWYTDYDQAVVDAQKEHKKIMLDFWAPYCSVCKLITKNVLQAPAIHRVLDQKYIVVSVNGNDTNAEPYKTLKERYNVQGFPDIIIIDPYSQEIIHRFKSELLDMDHKELIALL